MIKIKLISHLKNSSSVLERSTGVANIKISENVDSIFGVLPKVPSIWIYVLPLILLHVYTYFISILI